MPARGSVPVAAQTLGGRRPPPRSARTLGACAVRQALVCSALHAALCARSSSWKARPAHLGPDFFGEYQILLDTLLLFLSFPFSTLYRDDADASRIAKIRPATMLSVSQGSLHRVGHRHRRPFSAASRRAARPGRPTACAADNDQQPAPPRAKQHLLGAAAAAVLLAVRQPRRH